MTETKLPAKSYVFCGRYEMRHSSEASVKKADAAVNDVRFPFVIGDFSGAKLADVLAFATVSQGLTVAFRPAFRDEATANEANAWRALWTSERFAEYATCVPAKERALIEAGAPYIVLTWTDRGTLNVPPQVADMKAKLAKIMKLAGVPDEVIEGLTDDQVMNMFAATK